jgi:nicotinamidase-related amidase
VLVDVDTQQDFFLASGAATVRNHRRVLANVRRIIAWARYKNLRMISTAQEYHLHDRVDYCIEGTDGQKKLRYTIRNKHKRFAADGCTDLPREILLKNDQVILNKRCTNPFDEPRADRMLSELRADEFVLFGALTEGAIKDTALGLLARRKHVVVVTDALGSHNKEAAEVAIRQMAAKGAKLIDTKTMCGASALKIVGACSCDRCQGHFTETSLKANSKPI